MPIVKGLATYVPGLHALLSKHRTGGTDTAAYCYSVWMKHMCMSWGAGLRTVPETIAELGPGDSLGIGLAGLLSGVKRYFALDVVHYANPERNLEVFEDLVGLFRSRAQVNVTGWPDFSGMLDGNGFPSSIFTDERMDSALRPEWLDSIRASLRTGTGAVSYQVPWDRMRPVERVDYILSHSVMEHVTDPDAVYRACAEWLKPGGQMSHQIDFTSHSLTEKWNGYWQYPNWTWKLICGTRPFLINRVPFSEHARLLEKNGFELVVRLGNSRDGGMERDELAPEWKSLSEEDLRTPGAFFVARNSKDPAPHTNSPW